MLKGTITFSMDEIKEVLLERLQVNLGIKHLEITDVEEDPDNDDEFLVSFRESEAELLELKELTDES